MAWLAPEMRPALAFVAVAVAIFVAAAGIVTRQAASVVARGRLLPLPMSDRILLGIAGVGVGCVAYGRFLEPYRLQTTHVTVASRKLAGASRPIRVLHLSDTHCDPVDRLEPELPARVAAERPDLIVFTGDAINEPQALPTFRSLMRRLAAIAPTYAVRGNWDVWYWSRLDLYGGTSVVVLDGAPVRLNVAGAELALTGAAFESARRTASCFEGVPATVYTIFLHHSPDEIGAAAGRADLYCAGHTHGGQVALPFYGALVTFSRFGKRYEAGLYHVGETTLYVNRGIGMEGGSAPRVRFWAPPEIAVYELRGTT